MVKDQVFRYLILLFWAQESKFILLKGVEVLLNLVWNKSVLTQLKDVWNSEDLFLLNDLVTESQDEFVVVFYLLAIEFNHA
jgi:hypothetical protein